VGKLDIGISKKKTSAGGFIERSHTLYLNGMRKDTKFKEEVQRGAFFDLGNYIPPVKQSTRLVRGGRVEQKAKRKKGQGDGIRPRCVARFRKEKNEISGEGQN